MTKPTLTPRESHLRDVLNSVYVRVRSLETGQENPTEMRRECARIADFIRGRLDQEPKEDA